MKQALMLFGVRHSMSRWLVLAGWFSLAAAGSVRGADARVNFDRDIRTILSNNCFKCHGPDDKQRQAGLRLDTRDGQQVQLKSGNRAVVPGKRPESALVARITAADASERIPPASSGKILSAEQIELMKRCPRNDSRSLLTMRPLWTMCESSSG